MTHLLQWLYWHLVGWTYWPESGTGYAFFSSIGSTFFLGSVFAVGYRRLNCHSPRCLRLGLHVTADGLHHLCRHHHPDLAGRRRTLADIHTAHHEARARQ